MFALIKDLQQRWTDWCGDHDLEIAIRAHLTANGFYGRTAKLRNVRLVAVQRPGWLQVFRFEVTARVRPPGQTDEALDAEARYRELFGLVRDDIRHKLPTVRIFDSEKERRELFGRWSEDLICLRGAQGLTVR